MELDSKLTIRKFLKESKFKINWVGGSFFIFFAYLGPLYSFYHFYTEGISNSTIIALFTLFIFSGLSLSAGYHQLYSHNTYKAHPILQVFYLIIGASAMFDSALRFSHQHRIHHAKTGKLDDLYNDRVGFIWNQFLWVFFIPFDDRMHLDDDSLKKDYPNCIDLMSNKYVMLQHRWWVFIFLSFNLIILAIDYALNYGGELFFALVFVRIFLNLNSANLINSLSHRFGSKNKDNKENSATNNLLVAITSFGEGYHSNHHAYSGDYRFGPNWYDFDPTKWWIFSMSKLGLAKELKRKKD